MVGAAGLHDDFLRDGCAAGRRLSRLHALARRDTALPTRHLSRDRAAGAPRLHLCREDATGDLGHETLVTVTFADAGRGKTRLTLDQALFETESARDAHQAGWTSCLERFAAYLAGAAADH